MPIPTSHIIETEIGVIPRLNVELMPGGPAGPQGEPGPPGPTGPQGEIGPAGPSGSDANYVYEQMVASTVWTINHPLLKQPSVTTVDSEGRIIYGSVEYLSPTEIHINFLVANAGFAYLN